MNITQPAVYDIPNSCADVDLSQYDYIDEMPGYRPCFFLNFSRTHTFKYKLECKHLTADGLVDLTPFHMSQNYLDVINMTETDSQPQSHGKIINDRVTVAIDF